MNHLIRLLIITFWLIVAGCLYSVVSMGNNMIVIGWPTMLIYGFVTIITVSVGAVFSASGWNKFK